MSISDKLIIFVCDIDSYQWVLEGLAGTFQDEADHSAG